MYLFWEGKDKNKEKWSVELGDFGGEMGGVWGEMGNFLDVDWVGNRWEIDGN